MTRAQLADARRAVLPFAQQTGHRAYMFVDTPTGKREVRVWPDGRTAVTRVDGHGVPVAPPVRVRPWTRAARL